MRAPLQNTSSYYTVTLLTAAVDWDPSGVPLTDWHDEFRSEPAVTFDKYQWGGTTIVDPANVAMSTGSSFSHALNNYVINQGSSSDFRLDFVASLKKRSGSNVPPWVTTGASGWITKCRI